MVLGRKSLKRWISSGESNAEFGVQNAEWE
jgi:hypothetical protein